jgi:hypothetical protein
LNFNKSKKVGRVVYNLADDTPKSGGGGKSYNDLDDAFADLMS